MLIEAGKEECPVAFDGTAQGKTELLLLIVRLEVHERMPGRHGAVLEEIEISSVQAVGARFRDHIHYRASGPSQVSAVGVRRDAELLHYFVGKLVGCAIATTGLPEKGIVIVTTVHQIAGLVSADTAKGEVAVRARGQTTRIPRHSGSEQCEIGVTPPVKRKFVNGLFVNQCRNATGLAFDHRRLP